MKPIDSVGNLHIVIYSELMPYGGGRETWLGYFLPQAQKYFKKIFVYAIKRSAAKRNLLEELPFEVQAHYCTEINVLQYFREVKKSLPKNIADGDVCLMIGSIVEGGMTSWLRRNYGDKVTRVVWVRSISANEVAERHAPWLLPIVQLSEKRNLSNASLVITNGNDTYRYYDSYWEKKGKKLVAIPNAVNAEQFYCEKKWSENDKLMCVFIGRVEPEKGIGILLDAFSEFNRRHPELVEKVKLEIWGEGKMSGCRTLPNVFYRGKAERNFVPEILANKHVEFFITRKDDKMSGGVSHSLLEGLASGCVCICSDIPAYRQVVNDQNGVILQDQSPVGIANEIEKIYRSCCIQGNKKYEVISQNAVSVAREYSVERHMERFLESVNQINHQI